MHTFDRILSVVLALALVTLGILIPAEVIAALAGADTPLLLPYQSIADFLRENSWSSGTVIAIGVVIAALGLLLTVAELWPRRPGLYRVKAETEGVAVGVSRRSLARALSQATTDVAGITNATTSLGHRYAVIDATTPLRDPGDLAEQAQRQVDRVMESLALAQPLLARVRLRHREEDG